MLGSSAARLARLARQWIKERSISCFVKCGVHIFTGSFGSSGSPVHLRTRNNLYCVKCWVHIFSGSFGSSGSAVDQTTKYKLFWLSVEYIYLAARLARLWM